MCINFCASRIDRYVREQKSIERNRNQCVGIPEHRAGTVDTFFRINRRLSPSTRYAHIHKPNILGERCKVLVTTYGIKGYGGVRRRSRRRGVGRKERRIGGEGERTEGLRKRWRRVRGEEVEEVKEERRRRRKRKMRETVEEGRKGKRRREKERVEGKKTERGENRRGVKVEKEEGGKGEKR